MPLHLSEVSEAPAAEEIISLNCSVQSTNTIHQWHQPRCLRSFKLFSIESHSFELLFLEIENRVITDEGNQENQGKF